MGNIFSASVIKSISTTTYEGKIRDTIQGTNDLKKIMNKVFQKANRRIQNIEQSGLASPAYKALIAERGKIDSFTKFSISGLDLKKETDWALAKQEYARAIAYLNNPTSTATGTRQYINSIAQQYTKGDKIKANILVDMATEPTINETGVINAFQYGAIIEKAGSDVMAVLSNDLLSAEQYANQLEMSIQKGTQSVIAQINATSDEFASLFGTSNTSIKMK